MWCQGKEIIGYKGKQGQTIDYLTHWVLDDSMEFLKRFC